MVSCARVEKTYDILNCGPRNRFVVRDANGHPLIVHNCENLCQSLARDILAQSLPRIEAAGFGIVLTVHDEVVTEAPVSNDLSAERLAAIMAEVPDWAPGLPLAAAGFVAERYRK